MRLLKLKPWPFKKDEEVELYWLCSPYLKIQEGWFIKTAFKRNNLIRVVEFPWGTLPYLRLGQKYINGLPLEENKKGTINEVNILNETIEICTGFDMPYSLYYFYKNYECGIQRLCKFRVNNKTYYIPCTEIVRSFLTPSKTLANYIMKPNGLDFLIEESNIRNNSLTLSLSFEFPKSIITNETIAHLTWLKYNEQAHEAWNSVYNSLFCKVIEGNLENPIAKMISGVPIELIPPIRNNCRWTYRGITNGNSVLILEFIATTGFKIPFTSINYYHPSFNQAKTIGIGGTIKRNGNNKDEIYELSKTKSEQENSKNYQNQPIIDISGTTFVFDSTLNINKIKVLGKEIHKVVNVISTGTKQETRTTGKVMAATTQDWSSEGKIEPLEFKGLELVKGKIGKGLEDFYKTIEYIKQHYKVLDIAMCEVFLPEGKRFSYYPDGDRRNCAVVKISYENSPVCWIIEIGRDDRWSISTLFIQPVFNNFSLKKAEEMINILLNIAMDNNGHWDNKFLKNYRGIEFYKIKHISNGNIRGYVKRIIRKIL